MTTKITENGITDSAVTTNKIADDAVTNDKLATNAVDVDQIIDNSVTDSKLSDVDTNTIKGRATSGTGDIENLTPVQARGVLDVYSKAEVDSVLPLTEYFQSSELTITNGGKTTVAHGLSQKPKLIKTTVICKTAENGYAVGDEAEVFTNTTTGGVDMGILSSFNSTNISVRVGEYGFSVFNDVGEAGQDLPATNSRWRIIVRAWA